MVTVGPLEWIWTGNVTTWTEIYPYGIQQRSTERRLQSDKHSSHRKSAEARLRVPLVESAVRLWSHWAQPAALAWLMALI